MNRPTILEGHPLDLALNPAWFCIGWLTLGQQFPLARPSTLFREFGPVWLVHLGRLLLVDPGQP